MLSIPRSQAIVGDALPIEVRVRHPRTRRYVATTWPACIEEVLGSYAKARYTGGPMVGVVIRIQITDGGTS